MHGTARVEAADAPCEVIGGPIEAQSSGAPSFRSTRLDRGSTCPRGCASRLSAKRHSVSPPLGYAHVSEAPTDRRSHWPLVTHPSSWGCADHRVQGCTSPVRYGLTPAGRSRGGPRCHCVAAASSSRTLLCPLMTESGYRQGFRWPPRLGVPIWRRQPLIEALLAEVEPTRRFTWYQPVRAARFEGCEPSERRVSLAGRSIELAATVSLRSLLRVQKCAPPVVGA